MRCSVQEWACELIRSTEQQGAVWRRSRLVKADVSQMQDHLVTRWKFSNEYYTHQQIQAVSEAWAVSFDDRACTVAHTVARACSVLAALANMCEGEDYDYSPQQSPLVLLTSSGTLLGSLLSLHRRRWSSLQILGTHWLLPAFAKVADAICVLLEAREYLWCFEVAVDLTGWMDAIAVHVMLDELCEYHYQKDDGGHVCVFFADRLASMVMQLGRTHKQQLPQLLHSLLHCGAMTLAGKMVWYMSWARVCDLAGSMLDQLADPATQLEFAYSNVARAFGMKQKKKAARMYVASAVQQRLRWSALRCAWIAAVVSQRDPTFK
jgi:hypothetical protein